MKYEDLIKMGVKDLKARLKELSVQAKDKTGDDLEAAIAEAEVIDGILKDIQNRARLQGMAGAAAAADEGNTGDEGNGEGNEDPQAKARVTRGEALKAGKAVNYKAKAALNVKGQLSTKSSNVVLPNHTSSELSGTFNDVSSLIDRVKIVPLQGGETYERGYVKSYGDGARSTEENADYNVTEPTFGYVTISKQKTTAYTEEPEEMIKLPSADYDGVVEGSVTKAVRRFLTREILVGNGTVGHFYGIFHTPHDNPVIQAEKDVELTTVNGDTIDDIIYELGGDEEVEDMAVLILNKRDLKAMAKLRDNDGRKTYTIINHGNTGSIDGVPYIINSACKAITAEETSGGQYCMAYGPLSNYEVAIFSDIDVKRSEDFKFKSGQTAYRASVFAGGAPVVYNGFVRVKKK